MTTSSSRLKEILRQISLMFAKRGVRHALAGGMAMAAHGFPRATKDLDFLIALADAEQADQVMRSIGFQPASGARGFVRYIRHPLAGLPDLTEWADLLLASRNTGLELLEEAQAAPIRWEGLLLPVVSRGGLILMKLLAHVSDPRRLTDRSDIKALLGAGTEQLDRHRVRSSAEQLGSDVVALLDELERESANDQREDPANSFTDHRL